MEEVRETEREGGRWRVMTVRLLCLNTDSRHNQSSSDLSECHRRRKRGENRFRTTLERAGPLPFLPRPNKKSTAVLRVNNTVNTATVKKKKNQDTTETAVNGQD